jgi:translocation and assembly module TamB
VSAHEHDPTPAPVAPPRRGRLVRALGWGVALPLALLVGGGAWLAGTQSGLDAALGLAARATSGALQVDGARGRLLGRLDVDRLAWRGPGLELEVRALSLAWSPSALLKRRVDIEHLTAARVLLAQAVAEEEPAAAPLVAPSSLELPVAIALRRLVVGAFLMRELPAGEQATAPLADPASSSASARADSAAAAVEPGSADGAVPLPAQGAAPARGEVAAAAGEAAQALDRAADVASDPALAAEAATEVAAEQGLVFSRLEAALSSDGRHHRLESLAVELPQGRVRAALALDGVAPFALAGEAGFDGIVDAHAVAVQATLADSLLEPRLRAEATLGAARAEIEARVDSFAADPLRRLRLQAGGIDPAAFAAGAPSGEFAIEAELAAPASGEGLLAGPIRVTNARPAAVDAGGVPLEALSAQLDWKRAELAFDALELRLAGGGSIAGRVAWRPPAVPEAGEGGTQPASAATDGEAGTAADSSAPAATAPQRDTVAPAARAADGGFGQLVAALELAGIDTRALDGRLPRQIVAGRVDAEAEARRQTARLALAVGEARIDADASLSVAPAAPSVALAAAAAAGEGAPQPAPEGAVTAAPAPAPATEAPASAPAAAARSFTLSARLRGVDPRALQAGLPSARLNLDLDARGDLPAEGLPQAVALDFTIPDSRLDGRPLRGQGRLRLEGLRLPEAKIDLDVAGNTLVAEGAFGAPGDSLALRLDAPALAAIGFGLGGRAGAEGRIGGTLEAPNGRLDLFGENLALPGDVRLGGVNARVRLDSGIDGPFELALGLSRLGSRARAADGAAQPDWLASARVEASGTRARHRLDADFATPKLEGVADTLRLALEGGLPAGETPRWSGRLAALEAGGRFPARLQAPATLELGADRTRLGRADIEAGDKGRIRLLETAWSPTQSVLRGDLAGLVVETEPRRRDGRPRRNADPLSLGARWDLAVGRTLEGEARVFRESGDLSVEGELRTRLGLEKLEAVLSARGDRIELAVDVQGKELGSVQGEAGLRARRGADGLWSVPSATAIRGAARLDMPSLAWLGRLSQESVELAGRLRGDFTVGGTIEAPRASGRIEGRELGFTLVDQGLILAGGELDLDFDQQRVRLERLEFVSENRVRPRENRIPFERLTATPGRFTARGELALDSGAGDFRFDADRLPLLQRDDRWMLLSGGGTARSTWESLVLDAEFRADAGYIEFAEALPPSLSDDVVVLGRAPAAAQEGGGFAVNADVRVGLGDALYLSALGLETRLAGGLRIRLQPGRPLAAVGTIETVGGGYRGYGQNLTLERGLINFQGPLDAPGLNIVALRKGLEVEAGVAITGSAKRPQIKLVSDPEVPDPAKLSWIVLGRAPDAGSGADLGLLLPAAAALLGGPGGGMTEELSRSLGFDSFSIGQGELNSTTRARSSRVLGSGQTVSGGPSVSGQVLSLGKRLGPDLFLNFEQSLGGAATLVKLTYQISRRLSVIARGGTDTALDVQYGFSFR